MKVLQENFYNTLRRLSHNIPAEDREKASEFIRFMDMQSPSQEVMATNGLKFLKDANITPPPKDVYDYASLHSFIFFTEARTVLIEARQREASKNTGVTVTNFDYEEKLAWCTANILFFLFINDPTITKEKIQEMKVSFSHSLANIFNDDRVFSVSFGVVAFLASILTGTAGLFGLGVVSLVGSILMVYVIKIWEDYKLRMFSVRKTVGYV